MKAPRFGSGICLQRVDALLSALEIDRDWLSRSAVSITGSNGKGSTARICSGIARAHGFKTGLFISPHLYRYNERFQIDGREVGDSKLQESLGRAQAAAEEYCGRHPGEVFGSFEILFTAAVDLFFRNACEVCVYEAGIGGRYDPVRLVRASSAAVVSLDLEHTALLGDTLELIALDKTDICAPGGRVFYGTSCLQFSALLQIYCSLQGFSPFFLGQDCAFEILGSDVRGITFRLTSAGGGAENEQMSRDFFCPLLGDHQANNAALAVLLFDDWCAQAKTAVFSPDAAQAALSQTSWPGRLERVGDSPLTLIDVGHTPEGVRVALSALQHAYPGTAFALVCGVSEDKDADGILKILAPAFGDIVCTRAYHKGREPSSLAAIARKYNPAANVRTAPTIETACTMARTLAEEQQLALYAAGGMYLAAEFALAYRGEDPRDLPHE
jgi:dihydrofolate synthase/folylpolyglutamate synthase